MSIKAADVAKLRKTTGAGMMDCKKALTEAEGDFDRAIQIIRERGQSIASKRSDREASEGAVITKVSADGKKGALVALNCETDFVAMNEDFVAFVHTLAEHALATSPADINSFLSTELNGKKLSEAIAERSGVTGEKMEIASLEIVEADYVSSYIHIGNKIAVLIGFNQANVDAQIGKDVAMQVAAMAPIAIDKDGVDASTIEEELNVGREKARQEGKPEDMLDKIAQGRLGKFFKENTLLAQMSVKDNKITVSQMLTNSSKGLTVTAMKRFAVK